MLSSSLSEPRSDECVRESSRDWRQHSLYLFFYSIYLQ